MNPTDRTNRQLHSKLPIDDDETIIAIYRHHWFAYASLWAVAIALTIVILALGIFLTTFGTASAPTALSTHRTAILLGAAVLAVMVLAFSLIPVYLRSQEQLVLTDESLLQVLQPSLFSSKVDSVSLQRIDDVSIRQDFMGSIFGFGHITVETPGEQDNYEFFVLPKPHDVARQISKTKEDFEAALNAGLLPTSMGRAQQPAAPVAPSLDPQQYEQFLQYQQMVAKQQQEAAASQTGSLPAEPPQDDEQS